MFYKCFKSLKVLSLSKYIAINDGKFRQFNIFEQKCMVLHGIVEFICQMLDNVRKTEKISGITPQFAGDTFAPNGPLVLLLLENSKGYLN